MIIPLVCSNPPYAANQWSLVEERSENLSKQHLSCYKRQQRNVRMTALTFLSSSFRTASHTGSPSKKSAASLEKSKTEDENRSLNQPDKILRKQETVATEFNKCSVLKQTPQADPQH